MAVLVFQVWPVLLIVGVVFAAVKEVGKFRDLCRAWDSGLTAEARCLGVAHTYSRDGSTHTHAYEFTTRAGQTLQFTEKSVSLSIREGDVVAVYYTVDSPEKATARPPTHRKKAHADTVSTLIVFAIGICVAVAMLIYLGPMVAEHLAQSR
ncbi:DUF3592 domain-containing protein [Streptomyces sp. NPDC030392]|uniref:DUF3592 domain-containing protein n=1 Tax=Streptomyces sp. NPDC030392 TaxID=3155468 RepID=UPI0033CD053D